MAPLLERKLIVVTGKGGAGKIDDRGRAGAARRRAAGCARSWRRWASRTLPALPAHRVVRADQAESEPDGAARAGRRSSSAGPVEPLASTPTAALIEWLQRARRATIGARARLEQQLPVLRGGRAGSQGAGEHGQAARAVRRRGSARGYDLVVARRPRHRARAGDARARRTRSRRSCASGPLAGAARATCSELLGEPRAPATWRWRTPARWRSARRSSWRKGCDRRLNSDLDAVVVNGVLPRRSRARSWSESRRSRSGVRERAGAAERGACGGARRTARAGERARLQQNQLARLRRAPRVWAHRSVWRRAVRVRWRGSVDSRSRWRADRGDDA